MGEFFKVFDWSGQMGVLYWDEREMGVEMGVFAWKLRDMGSRYHFLYWSYRNGKL